MLEVAGVRIAVRRGFDREVLRDVIDLATRVVGATDNSSTNPPPGHRLLIFAEDMQEVLAAALEAKQVDVGPVSHRESVEATAAV